MSEQEDVPDIEALVRGCVARSPALTAADAADVVRLALSLGITPEEISAARDLGTVILDRRLRPLGGQTAREVVAGCGMGWGDAEPYLRAAGLPHDPDERVTETEAEAVQLIVGTARALLGDETTLQIARVTGSATARLAETLVDLFRLRVELPKRDAGIRQVDMVEEYSALALALLPVFSRTLDALLRRQVLSVASSVWSTDEERSAVTVRRTVGFVDLVGYTVATASMTVRELTRVLMDFEHVTSDVVSRHAGSVVKSIGDEILYATESPSAACRIALELLDASGGLLPEVRIGMARGELVTVFGDLYGPDVNLAARLVSAADPTTAVVSESVRAAAPEFEYEALPPLQLKGLAEPVTAYRLRSPATS